MLDFEMMTNLGEKSLVVRLHGPTVEQHRLSVDDFSRLVQNLQLAVKRLAQVMAGKTKKTPGRLIKDIEAACSLDIVASKAGSYEVQLALPEKTVQQPGLFGHLGIDALQTLVSGIDSISQDKWPSHFAPPVLDPIYEVGRLLQHGIDEIELSTATNGKLRRVHYTRFVRDSIAKKIESPVRAKIKLVGHLLEVDFKDHTAEVHEITGNVVKVAFSADFDELMREAAKSVVKVLGEGQRTPDNRIVKLKLEHLEIMDPTEHVGVPLDLFADEAKGLEVGEAASKIQATPITPWKSPRDPFKGALPIDDPKQLLGGLPDERDPGEILDDLEQLRRPSVEEE